jgi:hypothetical protein
MQTSLNLNNFIKCYSSYAVHVGNMCVQNGHREVATWRTKAMEGQYLSTEESQ